MEGNENLLSNDLHIDSISFNYLRETSKWAKFLAIIGFIMTGVFVLFAFFGATMFSTLMRTNPYGGDIAGSFGFIITIVYLIVAAISFFLSLFLYRFGARTLAGLQATDQDSLNDGIGNLKSFFKMYGIIVIIYLGFLALALLLGVLGAMFSR